MIMSADAPGAFRGPSRFPGVLVPLDMDALLPGSLAAKLAGVSVQAIVYWRNVGHLPVATDEQGREIRDERGRPRYRVRDILAAEAKAADRCERMAGRVAVRSPGGIAA